MNNQNDDGLISAAETAKLLGLGARYFSEEFIFQTPSFPKAYRYGNGPRRYNRAEVLAWRETQRETA